MKIRITNVKKTNSVTGEIKMQGTTTKLSHVISIGLIADRAKLLEFAVKELDKPIVHITGKATGSEIVPAKKDSVNQRPTTYIKGNFKAVDLLQNITHLSGQLILPDSASAFISAQEMPYQVDVTLRVCRAEKSITGYKFECDINNYVDGQEQSVNLPTDAVVQPEEKTDKSIPKTKK